jgi:hypothetical protein
MKNGAHKKKEKSEIKKLWRKQFEQLQLPEE